MNGLHILYTNAFLLFNYDAKEKVKVPFLFDDDEFGTKQNNVWIQSVIAVTQADWN